MKTIACLVVLGVALSVPVTASACTIPVFRYALEKWDLTPCEVLVFHDQPLSKELQRELKKWDVVPSKANLEFTLIDLNGKVDPKIRKLWDREGKKGQSPWMLVRYASMEPTEPSAWSGPCTLPNLANLIDSPLRQAILAHLSRGASVVNVLVTSNDRAADEAAYALLKKELESLEKRIKLPAQSPDGPKLKLPLPLKVTLPLLILDRNKPEEAGFLRLLLGTEERLADMKGPILFPIFGRGRVLGSLCHANKELTAEQVLEVTKFLCRECSCQIKDLNPGIDTLMRADWVEMFDRLFDGKEPMAMPKEMPTTLPREAPKAAPPARPNPVSVFSRHAQRSAVIEARVHHTAARRG